MEKSGRNGRKDEKGWTEEKIEKKKKKENEIGYLFINK